MIVFVLFVLVTVAVIVAAAVNLLCVGALVGGRAKGPRSHRLGRLGCTCLQTCDASAQPGDGLTLDKSTACHLRTFVPPLSVPRGCCFAPSASASSAQISTASMSMSLVRFVSTGLHTMTGVTGED